MKTGRHRWRDAWAKGFNPCNMELALPPPTSEGAVAGQPTLKTQAALYSYEHKS